MRPVAAAPAPYARAASFRAEDRSVPRVPHRPGRQNFNSRAGTPRVLPIKHR